MLELKLTKSLKEGLHKTGAISVNRWIHVDVVRSWN